MGELLTGWTIRLSLVCYVAFLLSLILCTRHDAWTRTRRWLWSGACLLFFAHATAAFHFYHRWSHAEALADTARQTRELLGWPFGAGIYFSYVFAALWLGDAMWWWVGRASYERRPKWLSVATHAYIFFIIFNGAIVFETGITRPTGIVACTMLAIALLVRQGQAATRAILLGLSGAAL